jgi:hypothetical protein
LPQTHIGCVGHARDGVDISQALLQYNSIEYELRKAKVERDFVGIEIVQSHYGRARIRGSVNRNWIGEMSDIGSERADKMGKARVVPGVSAHQATPHIVNLHHEAGICEKAL